MHKNKKFTPYLFIIPGLLLLLLFVYYPIFQNIRYSFLDWELFSGTKKFIGLKNYLKLFKSDTFWMAFRNNIYYIVISLIFQVGFSLILAAILENMKFRKLSAIYRTTFFVPSLISLILNCLRMRCSRFMIWTGRKGMRDGNKQRTPGCR